MSESTRPPTGDDDIYQLKDQPEPESDAPKPTQFVPPAGASPPQSPTVSPSRRTPLVIAAVALLAIAGGIAAWFALRQRPADNKPAEAAPPDASPPVIDGLERDTRIKLEKLMTRVHQSIRFGTGVPVNRCWQRPSS
jgi:hypothetical protein